MSARSRIVPLADRRRLRGRPLIVAAIFDPKIAAAGWLVGFAFWGQILIGSLTLVMIHRLTSGRWGELIAPVSETATAAVPVLIVLAVPLFIAIPALYPWLRHPAGIKSDVLSVYLNVPAFIARPVIALAGWSTLARLLPRTRGVRGQFVAALGLVFHGLIVCSVAIDWYLSLEAPFVSSSFGASVAISSLVAALAFAALIAPMPADDPAIGDVGGLLLATVLGITYIDFMAVLVIWYGDLPHEEIWFVERDGVAMASAGLGGVHSGFAASGPCAAARPRPQCAALLARGRSLRAGRPCALRRLSDRAPVGLWAR